MKNDFLNLISILLILFMGTIAPIHAQNNKKLNVYVKNFTYNDANLESIGKDLTSKFESELVNLEIYNVLERNRFDRLMKAMETENKISDIQKIKTAEIDSLKAYKAEALFFGHIECYRDDGRCKVTIALQDIYQGNNIKKDYMTIVIEDIKNSKLRDDFVKGLLKKLYAKEILTLKKEQLVIIERKLSTYRARVKEVIDLYEEKIDYLLDLPENKLRPHLDEIDQKRKAFNSIWNDLNNNKRIYIKNFGLYWGKESTTALKYVYSETMEDFHPKFRSDINYLQTRINKYRQKEYRNKREKEDEKNELTTEIKHDLVKMDELYYNDVDKKINVFLDNLGEELNQYN